MKNLLHILKLALTLLAITSFVALALAGVNALTKQPIADQKAEKLQAAITEVLPGGGEKLEASAYKDETKLVSAVYAGENGYAVEVKPVGFNGEITMMVGIGLDGKVLGISVVTQTETAGLGAVVADGGEKGQNFRNQFAGMEGILAVKKDGGEVEAVSGATISSRAVTAGVNAALACVKTIAS